MPVDNYPLFSKKLQKEALYRARSSNIPKGTLEWFEARRNTSTSPIPTSTPEVSPVNPLVPPGLIKRQKIKENDPYEDELLAIPSYELFFYQEEWPFNYINLLDYVSEFVYSTPLFTYDSKI